MDSGATCACADHLGLLSEQDLAKFKNTFVIVQAATTAFKECFSVVKLLKGPKLNFLRQDSMAPYCDGPQSRMTGVFDAVMLMLLVSNNVTMDTGPCPCVRPQHGSQPPYG
jgi:hypothetical protein